MGELNGAFVVMKIILRNQNIHVNNVLNVKKLKVNYGCKRNGNYLNYLKKQQFYWF